MCKIKLEQCHVWFRTEQNIAWKYVFPICKEINIPCIYGNTYAPYTWENVCPICTEICMEIRMLRGHRNEDVPYAWKYVCLICTEISMPHMHGNEYAPYA
jgi:hypothetical protein